MTGQPPGRTSTTVQVPLPAKARLDRVVEELRQRTGRQATAGEAVERLLTLWERTPRTERP